MKTLLKILKVFFIIILVLAALIVVWYLWADNAPVIHKGYNEKIETGGAIEKKYLQNGTYETSKETMTAENPIKKYTIFLSE